MFLLLVWCAKNGKKITYGQLDAEFQRRGWGHHVNIVLSGHPAGAIGDVLLKTEQETGEKIPPLNAVVVNAKSGAGRRCDYYLTACLDERRGKKLAERRQSMAEETIDEMWRFQNWDKLFDSYGFKPVNGGIPSHRSNIDPRAPGRGGWSNEPESKEHQALKRWVAKSPKLLNSSIPFQTGETDWLFASADRVDVLFAHDRGCVAVEVKPINANDADLERGVYQCVKYQALLRAELKTERKVPNGLAVLVTERQLPQTLANLANLLGIRVITVRRV